MPTINKKEIKEKSVKYKHDSKSTDFYGSMAWRRLRDTFISLHPICECCLEHGKVEPATECHHRRPFLRGENEEEQWKLFLDEKNLMAVDSKCHTALHVKDNMYHMDVLDDLSEKEWKYAHNILD